MTPLILKPNGSKTNIIYLASLHCVKSLKIPALQMGASSVTPNRSVKKSTFFFTNALTCLSMSHQYAELPTTILRTSTV